MNKKSLISLEFNKITEMLQNEASFDMSKNLALNLVPSEDYNEAVVATDMLKCAIYYINKKGSPSVSGFKDISMSLKRIEKGGMLSISELLSVGTALKIAENVVSYFDEECVFSCYYEKVLCDKNVRTAIFNAIESEDRIADSASTELGGIRRKINETHAKIREHLNSIIHSTKYQKYLQENIVTIRDGRYVVPVKSEHRSDVPGIVHDMSATGSTIFVEPNAVVNENNKLKELAVAEAREIDRILGELTLMVEPLIHNLFVNQHNITEIDLAFAKGRLALKMNAIVPIINRDKYINIVKGRHPLIDAKTVVPVSVYLGKDFKTLVITGPNTGGKTVTLKTIGLFCLMAAAGLGVPASDGTELPVFENIYADIGDEQSIEQSLSTFSSHMTNIVEILNSATDNSLVLFDELGAGTDPTEGAALAVSILKYTKDLGMLTVATTHYSEIKMYALSTPGVENASCEFDVDSLRPTYKLLIGVPGKSNAFAISKRLGLPEFLVENAKKQLTDDSIRFEDVISKLEESRTLAEKEHNEAIRYKNEAEQLRKETEKEKTRLADTRRNLTENAKKEAKKILEDAKRDAEVLVKSIREAKKQKSIQETNKALNDAMEQINKKIKENEKSNLKKQLENTEVPKNLIIGNTVEMLDIGQKGTVIALPKADGTVTVQAGIMKVQTNISNLRLVKDAPKKSVTKQSGSKLKSDAVKNEIDLRGYTLEDALFVTDKFLDEAYFAKLNQVTIIHGKGTGVLRQGIHDLLRKSPVVKSYRLGTFGEGETGVTVVEIKK
ncbi:MAG: endonuclease MutS2 [Clostridia bacterium]|nr:endonuclease MutS2 [Clostridia bacterium]